MRIAIESPKEMIFGFMLRNNLFTNCLAFLEYRETIYANLCKSKEKSKMQECKDVVYLVPCEECGVWYIGESRQHFCEMKKPTPKRYCNWVL